MLGMKKVKVPEDKKIVCRECGLYYGDKESVDKHVNLAHPWIIYIKQQN
jgi:uncharacterized C2H2 Zn-finger protein